ncbi:MAG: hypothetical protein JO177_04175 [Candidatus Eremiobacteraeota bacterium]|nr:hypothetical protein [Candidatus Eremiobacteraeota bacterium]
MSCSQRYLVVRRIAGFSLAMALVGGSRIGRPTGVAVGPQGDLFVADDQTGNIYRIRP